MRFVLCFVVLLCGQVCVAQTVCQNGQCRAVTKSETSTAQGVANLMSRLRKIGHFGGNRGYEGTGMGSTPEQALRNCCYSNSGMAVVDQGVAQGSDGKWYACKRYSK
jgi:hypothetical protein